MLSITNFLRVALALYTLLHTLNTFPTKRCLRVKKTWERATVLYVLLVTGYLDPVVGALLSAILLLHLCEKESETLVIEKMTPPSTVPSKKAVQNCEAESASDFAYARVHDDPAFLLTEETLRKTQTNQVGNANLFPNETNSPGVNIQGVFDDITGVQL